MVLKRVIIHFRMSDDVINALYTEFPNIIHTHEVMDNKVILHVDITPAQESNAIPVLLNKLIKIEAEV